VLLARFAEVDVHVDKTGSHNQAACIKHLDIRRRLFILSEPTRNFTVIDQEVFSTVLALDRIDQMAVFN